MVLVHRYHASIEHSDLFSTSPHTSLGRSGKTRLISEATEWVEAACPPMEDICDVIGRLQSDPDLSQANIFYQCLPPCLFVSALVLASSLLRGTEHRQSEEDHGVVMRRLAFYGGMVCIALVTLRIMVWLGAKSANGSVGHGAREATPTRRKRNSPLLEQHEKFEGIPM
ncbi:hypothetical protein NEOLEDRAFT_1142772 [Neolentinus lepideus HHB14362 ss-1]|uniref:Uncharacterized protein n=1 Tax=Neolentinus lepideus HHB14362 ss-1 TaxID=1314782 RepID=A0A165MXL8_9AGAM|nr:hypothetical protein NEOLEDRAFT_1142772 [Neolentinus lepideus HHB14362 ss-1]